MISKKLKVLQIISSMGKGGAERYVADICVELSKRQNIEVLLISMSPINYYKFLTDTINYKVTNSKVLPSITKKSIIDIDHYLSIVNEFKPDIIHSHLFHTELLSKHLIDKDIVYVTTCQNNMPEFSNFQFKYIFNKSKLTKFFEKHWILKKYKQCNNNFIVISKDTENYYKSSLPKTLNNIYLLYHAINFERFNNASNKRIVKQGIIKLIYVARFVPIKNQMFLVEITKLIKDLGYKVETVLIGDGETKEKIQEKIQQLKIQSEVKLAGLVDNVEEYLKEANIYVHPAIYEPFGLVIIEAMAAGLPVICLNGKGNRDLIIDDYNGFMFDDEKVELFASKIITLFENQEKYNEISNNCIKYAQNYSIDKHVDKLLTLYNVFTHNKKLLR